MRRPTMSDEADLVILNTCHIREKAAEKVYSELGRMRAVKQARDARGLDTMIAVAGCVAQAEGSEILRARASGRSRGRAAELSSSSRRCSAACRDGGERVVDTEFPAEDKFLSLPERPIVTRAAFGLPHRAGRLRQVLHVLRRALYARRRVSRARRGDRRRGREACERPACARLTLLGQNVNAYHGAGPDGADWSLAKLLRRLADIPEIERLRYTTSHPRDMDDDLIALHGDEPKLMPYLHLPFQSGSDRILHAMNRKHTADDYAELVDRIRRRARTSRCRPTLLSASRARPTPISRRPWRLSARIGFAQAFSFKYSARPGTPAASLPRPGAGQRSRGSGSARLAKPARRRSDRPSTPQLSGGRLPVLFERQGRKPGQIVGRSPYLQAVHADGPEGLIGRIVEVDIVSAGPNSLTGVIKSEFEWREPVQAAV